MNAFGQRLEVRYGAFAAPATRVDKVPPHSQESHAHSFQAQLDGFARFRLPVLCEFQRADAAHINVASRRNKLSQQARQIMSIGAAFDLCDKLHQAGPHGGRDFVAR